LSLLASEYAHGPTIVLVMAACVLVAATIGRWWTLAVPVAVAAGVFALSLDDRLYSRVAEDVQAAIVFGATYGLILGAVALFLRWALRRWARDTSSEGAGSQ
jgi:hypothetical protein